MLGHWERRRHFGETDDLVTRKVEAALAAGLRPILMVGEPSDRSVEPDVHLPAQLERLLAGCAAEDVARMVIVYEPEEAVGAPRPIAPRRAWRACALIRTWVWAYFGEQAAQSMRVIYGGAVAPEHAARLLGHPDVDGLGVGRKGREPITFVTLIYQIALAKGTGQIDWQSALFEPPE